MPKYSVSVQIQLSLDYDVEVENEEEAEEIAKEMALDDTGYESTEIYGGPYAYATEMDE